MLILHISKAEEFDQLIPEKEIQIESNLNLHVRTTTRWNAPKNLGFRVFQSV